MAMTEKKVKESKEYYCCLEQLSSDSDTIENAFTIAKYILEQKQDAVKEERKRIMTDNKYLAGLIKAKEQRAVDNERKRIIKFIKEQQIGFDRRLKYCNECQTQYCIDDEELAELENNLLSADKSLGKNGQPLAKRLEKGD